MADDNQSKIDAAAEKAFADAAEKKAAEASKPKPVTSEAIAPVVKSDTAPKAVAAKASAPAKKPVARKAPAAKKPAIKKAARKTAAKKAPAKAGTKAPTKTVAAAKIAKPTTTITQLKDKIMATTNTTDFTAKMKETAADMQTRLKTAYDKGAEMTKDVTEFHKHNLEAVVESGKVLAAGMQDMGRTAIETVKTDAEIVTADVKKMAGVKNPTELFQLQGEIARRNLDTMVSRASKGAEAWMKLVNDAFAPISSRASVAMDKIKTAA